MNIDQKMEHVLHRLKKARKDAGHSQQFVADQFGWNNSMISQIENGKQKLRVFELLHLCDLYKTSPIYILTGTHAIKGRPVSLSPLAQPPQPEIHLQPALTDRDKQIMNMAVNNIIANVKLVRDITTEIG